MTRRAGSLFAAMLLAFMMGCPEAVDTGGSTDDLCDPACAAGQTCENGVCVTGQTPDDTCNPACAAGETCVDGACVADQPADPCADVTCADGETCVDGACVADQPAGGNATDGESFYTANGCVVCHLADATGSIGPNIVGKGAARVLEVLTVAGAHGIGPMVAGTTQQDADDVAAFLGSL